MRRLRKRKRGWAIKRRSENQLDGKSEALMGGARYQRPPQFAGYTTMVFATRQEARAYVKSEYSYIARRADLRQEPHGWKIPSVVPVIVSVEESA